MTDQGTKKALFGGKRSKKLQNASVIPDGMKGGVFYIRVSTDKQEESGLGLESQKDILENFAKREKIYQIGETFVEVGSGGSKIENRPVLLKAKDLAEEYNAYIVVAKLDRLARRLETIVEFKKINLKFVTAEYGFCADSLIINIMSAIAEKERELIAERTKNALQQKKKQYDEEYEKALKEYNKNREENKKNGIPSPKKRRLGIPSVSDAPSHIAHQRRKEGLERKRMYYEKYILPTKIELENEFPGEKITRKKLAERMKLKGFKTEYEHPFSESVIYHTLKDLKISLKKAPKRGEASNSTPPRSTPQRKTPLRSVSTPVRSTPPREDQEKDISSKLLSELDE